MLAPPVGPRLELDPITLIESQNAIPTPISTSHASGGAASRDLISSTLSERGLDAPLATRRHLERPKEERVQSRVEWR